jgi:glycosyltransferase involved in cell wall biosynthesis
MARLKVIEVIECGGPGGTGSQVAAICNHLNPDRFDVGLAYAVRPGYSAEEYRSQAHGAKKAFHIAEMTREISPARDIKAFQELVRIFQSEKPDIVHAHSSKAGALARLAAKRTRIPHIYYSPHGYSFQMDDRSMSSRYTYRFLERMLSHIGHIVAVSVSEAALARTLTSLPVHIIYDAYLGPLPDIHEVRERPLKIGACGRLTHARNPRAFVKLAQRVTDSRNDVSFVWIGDGELRSEIDEMILDMNLKSRLEVTGWLGREELHKRLGELDIFVHFTRWEGLPNAVLEAMAHGLPVLASDIPGNRDLVIPGENGFLVKSEMELLEQTLETIDQPDLRQNMGQAGHARIKKDFTINKTISALEHLYLGDN